jgi:hypothetical protein
VNHTSKVIPWFGLLELFECHYATKAASLDDDLLHQEPFQGTLGLIIFLQACSQFLNLSDRLGRRAVKELGKTPASLARLGTEFGYEHQCLRGAMR